VDSVAQGESISFREPAGKAEAVPLSGGDDVKHVCAEQAEEQAERSFNNELLWPPRGKLTPNWTVQFIFLPILGILRAIGWTAHPGSHTLYVALDGFYFPRAIPN